MVNMKPNDSVEAIAVDLRAQAVRLWGEQRAGELEESIQQTAQQWLSWVKRLSPRDDTAALRKGHRVAGYP